MSDCRSDSLPPSRPDSGALPSPAASKSHQDSVGGWQQGFLSLRSHPPDDLPSRPWITLMPPGGQCKRRCPRVQGWHCHSKLSSAHPLGYRQCQELAQPAALQPDPAGCVRNAHMHCTLSGIAFQSQKCSCSFCNLINNMRGPLPAALG